jgi:hypothetical protein
MPHHVDDVRGKIVVAGVEQPLKIQPAGAEVRHGDDPGDEQTVRVSAAPFAQRHRAQRNCSDNVHIIVGRLE